MTPVYRNTQQEITINGAKNQLHTEPYHYNSQCVVDDTGCRATNSRY